MTFVKEFNIQMLELIAHSRGEVRKVCGEIYTLPCYANLPLDEQMRIFQSTPFNHRKIIVASNIAETSITVPGVAFVIDCCFTKVKFFDADANMDKLIVVPASKANCD